MGRGKNIVKNSWYKDIEKKATYMTLNHRVKCSCGHSLVMVNKDKEICSWCGKWVFKDKQEEFKYRLNLTLNK